MFLLLLWFFCGCSVIFFYFVINGEIWTSGSNWLDSFSSENIYYSLLLMSFLGIEFESVFFSSAVPAGVSEAGTFASSRPRRVLLPLRLASCVATCVGVSALLHCFPGRAAAPHWLFLPSWPRPLTQNTFAISFIPSPDGARRSFMRGLPKARTVTGRTSLPPTRRFILPRFFPPPPFLPFLHSAFPFLYTKSHLA